MANDVINNHSYSFCCQVYIWSFVLFFIGLFSLYYWLVPCIYLSCILALFKIYGLWLFSPILWLIYLFLIVSFWGTEVLCFGKSMLLLFFHMVIIFYMITTTITTTSASSMEHEVGVNVHFFYVNIQLFQFKLWKTFLCSIGLPLTKIRLL